MLIIFSINHYIITSTILYISVVIHYANKEVAKSILFESYTFFLFNFFMFLFFFQVFFGQNLDHRGQEGMYIKVGDKINIQSFQKW